MTSDTELMHALRGVPGFAGVFAADEVAQLYNLPNNRRFILNTNARTEANSVGHWVAMDTGDISRPPQFFDSFGQDVSQIQPLLNQPYNEQWARLLQHYAKRNGRASHTYNHFDLQCVVKRGAGHTPSDLCGEYCALFIKWGPVQDAQGRIRINWRQVTSIAAVCDAHERLVRRISGVKRGY